MAQWLVVAALVARGARAETEDVCWERIKGKVDAALTKGADGQLRDAEAAALVAYVWARSRPNPTDSAAAANVLLDALEAQGHSIEAAAVACELNARLSSTSETLAELRARAIALCAEAEEQRGAPLSLVVPRVQDCSEPGPWHLQVMIGAEPTNARTFEALDSSTASRELRVEVRAAGAPPLAPPPARHESVASPLPSHASPGPQAAAPTQSTDPTQVAAPSPARAPIEVPIAPAAATLALGTEPASSPGFCSGSRLLPCGLGGVGIGALASAAVVGGIALKKENDAAARCPARDGCSDDATAREASDMARSAGRFAIVSDALWIGGALATVGGLVWYLLSDEPPAHVGGPAPVSVSCDGQGCQLSGGARF